MLRAEFEKLLKESAYFADVVNTHRTATAQVMVAILADIRGTLDLIVNIVYNKRYAQRYKDSHPPHRIAGNGSCKGVRLRTLVVE